MYLQYLTRFFMILVSNSKMSKVRKLWLITGLQVVKNKIYKTISSQLSATISKYLQRNKISSVIFLGVTWVGPAYIMPKNLVVLSKYMEAFMKTLELMLAFMMIYLLINCFKKPTSNSVLDIPHLQLTKGTIMSSKI